MNWGMFGESSPRKFCEICAFNASISGGNVLDFVKIKVLYYCHVFIGGNKCTSSKYGGVHVPCVPPLKSMPLYNGHMFSFNMKKGF